MKATNNDILILLLILGLVLVGNFSHADADGDPTISLPNVKSSVVCGLPSLKNQGGFSIYKEDNTWIGVFAGKSLSGDVISFKGPVSVRAQDYQNTCRLHVQFQNSERSNVTCENCPDLVISNFNMDIPAQGGKSQMRYNLQGDYDRTVLSEQPCKVDREAMAEICK